VTLFVDTSVWSLALRRDAPASAPEAEALRHALGSGQELATTGFVLQELLQGFAGPRARDRIIAGFGSLPFVWPDRHDHVEAAELRNRCRRACIQVGTIDAIVAQLCVRYGMTLLATDKDFQRMTAHSPLKVWRRHD
jgi:predicted nucleic acid-binding protein